MYNFRSVKKLIEHIQFKINTNYKIQFHSFKISYKQTVYKYIVKSK